MATLLENFFYYLRRIIPVFSSKKKSKMITSAFLLIAFFISVSQWITCPSSSPISNLITTEQCNFTGFSSTSVYSVLTGIISNSLYYMYGLSGSISGWTIRRINPDGSLNWMINISSFTPIMTGFSVDDNELYAYVANLANPLDVARLSAVTGGIIDVQRL